MTEIEIEKHDFLNIGVLKTKLPKELYNKLLKECLKKHKKQNQMISGVTANGVPLQFYIEDNYEELIDFIKKFQKAYMDIYPTVTDVKILDKDVPFSYLKPWINIMKENEIIPIHEHDGVLSYNIWMQIPYDSSKEKYLGNFVFSYSDTLGKIRTHKYPLSKIDEGSIIMFPSKLSHQVYPFTKNKKTRISIAGNIVLKG